MMERKTYISQFMNKDSELSRAIPPSVLKISSTLKRAGIIGFWVQLVLGVIGAVTLLFAIPILLQNREKTQGSEFGILCAILGLILVGVSIYMTIVYGRIARKLQNPDPTNRPKKTYTLKMVRIGLIVNLVGSFIAIVGAQALVGLVLAKSLARGQITLSTNPSEFVNSIDLLIIQANTNTIMANFAGVINGLWLLTRITR